MTTSSIPVDLLNPGQVFACMGFLKAADVLLGHAEGGFDWTNEAEPRFDLRARGTQSPVEVVLGFLVEAQLKRLAPRGYADPPSAESGREASGGSGADNADDQPTDVPLCLVTEFPAPMADASALPLRFEHRAHRLDVTHWCDGSSRNKFKLFAGRQQCVNGSPNPEARVLGGVLVRGRIERDVTVNLVALRSLRGATDAETEAIRKYLLGLSLVAATADIDPFLREGCLLRYAEDADMWYEVPRRGEPTQVALAADMLKLYAMATANHFRAKWPQVFKDRWPAKAAKTPDLKYEFDLGAA